MTLAFEYLVMQGRGDAGRRVPFCVCEEEAAVVREVSGVVEDEG